MATANFHKAAVVIGSLPKPQAAEVLGRLAPEQASAVSGELGQLRQLTREEQEAAIREFATACGTRSVPATLSPFQCLSGLDGEDLLAILADEQPQTIALILSYLPVEQAAEAIDALEPERQAAVLGRIAAMNPPSPEIVRDVAAGVQGRLAVTGRKPRAHLFGLVKMLNAMRPAAERRLLGAIGQSDPDLLGEIRCVMFGDDVAACGAW